MNRLKEIRENNDLNQEDIAKILNMSIRGYGKYESEENDISTKNLKILSLFYNVSVDYILYKTDDRKPYPRSKEINTISKKKK